MAGKAKDLTGYTTETGVVVLQRVENKNNRPQWLCKCFCGNIFVTRSDALKSGHTRSCGCLQKKIASETITKWNKSLALDLTNQKFGKLTALKSLNTPCKGGTSILWQCVCECGNHCIVSASHLTTGQTFSCGCIKSKGEAKIQSILENNNILFEKQKQFNDCRLDRNIRARFDFYLPEFNTIIEYDGNIHFYTHNSGWNNEDNLKKVQKNDKIKTEYCRIHKIPLIRIPYYHYNELCLEDLMLNTSKFIVRKENV